MRKLNKVILASLMGWTILINPSVEAGIVTDRFPIQTYADHQVNTYNNPGDSKRAGYASANVDLIRVLEYRQDGWARVQHPGAGGRIVNRWCRMTDLCADPNYSNRSVKINGRYVVYRTRSSGSQFGSVNNEEVIVLADNGNRAQILYKLDNGQGYKIGWIASSAVASRGTTQNNTIKTNPMINTNVQHNQVIANGWYQISPQHDQGRVLDVAGIGTANGTNLQTWSRGDVNQQKFYVQNRGNGYFSLKAGHCDLYVTADGTNGGANVSMRTWNGRDSQLFRAENAGNGYYYIISKASNLIMECAGGGRRDGNNVSMWHKDATVGWYKWRFIGTQMRNSAEFPSSIYLTQNPSGNTCTLVAAAMMHRAKLYLKGDNSWNSITENNLRQTAWSGGLKRSWTYRGMSVTRVGVNGISLSTLKSILNSHPEGIVLYCGYLPHAVWLNGYKGDTLYCADPLPSYSKPIPIGNSHLARKKGTGYGNQANILNHVTAYWYIQ